VYLHLLQSPRKVVQNYLLTQTHRYTDQITEEQKAKILDRTHSKSDWALVEIAALEKVYRWKWKLDRGFRGSFSGAFGMPQFLPSSYVRWARSSRGRVQPDLSRAPDAIFSVGHYLKDHGWRQDRSESQITALMKYNNSRDYAMAILKLAEKLENSDVASRDK
jgi:membrane-bound lytic murein transglycosylase B